MPKNKFEDVIFTIFMATIMVYGMVVYNVSLNTGGVSGTTFLLALHELPIMSLIATVLFKTPSLGTWVETFAMNFPMAFFWQMFFCGPLVRLIFRSIFRRDEAKEPQAAQMEG